MTLNTLKGYIKLIEWLSIWPILDHQLHWFIEPKCDPLIMKYYDEIYHPSFLNVHSFISFLQIPFSPKLKGNPWQPNPNRCTTDKLLSRIEHGVQLLECWDTLFHEPIVFNNPLCILCTYKSKTIKPLPIKRTIGPYPTTRDHSSWIQTSNESIETLFP